MGGMSQGAMDGGVTMYRMYRMYGQVIAPSITCTSTIHGGRMSQGARDGGARMYRKYGQAFTHTPIFNHNIFYTYKHFSVIRIYTY
jgi:hypothetical protein